MEGAGVLTVTGLGQCSLDYIASVDGYPAEDTKAEARSLTIQGGGPVATALVALARLGVRARFMGRVSDDPPGEEIRRGLALEGVDTEGLASTPGGESQTAFIIVNSRTGSRTILWKRPTVAPLAPTDVDPSAIAASDMLLLDGLMMDASLEAARAAADHGVPVMLDAGSLRPGMMELAGMCDYVVCSERFARELVSNQPGPADPIKTLEELSALNPVAATVTLGVRGSVTRSGAEVFATPAFEVPVVDTTGAGDVFHGGYAYGVLRGWDLPRTVRFASAFAALKCTRPGTRTGIPGLEDTLRFMDG